MGFLADLWGALRGQRGDAAGIRAADVTQSMTPQQFAEWVRGQYEPSGVITERSAMSVGAVYAAVGLIAGAIASMPLCMYRRSVDEKGRAKREEITPDEWWLLNEQPHVAWSAATAWEYAVASLLLHGDSFWRIRRVSPFSPAIASFEPLHPNTVVVTRRDGRMRYQISQQLWETADPGRPPAYQVLDQDDMLHIPGVGFDGLRGCSLISHALRNSGAAALTADEYAGSFLQNGARPDLIIKSKGKLTTKQIEDLRTQWIDRHGGTAKAGGIAVLGGDLDVTPITMTAADAQLIEQRRFSVEDIARIFGVPPFMIGSSEKTTSWGSGVEAMGTGFVRYTIGRHLRRFEVEINRKVFRTSSRFARFDVAALTRGDLAGRATYYRAAIGRAGERGWMSVNEVREAEDYPPTDDGDQMTPVQTPAKAAPGGDTNGGEPGGNDPAAAGGNE